MRGRPRFFCEFCGAEVPKNAKSCPQCGRYFASVLCPSCGFAGDPGLFTGGCPVCGYSAPPPGPVPRAGKEKPPKTVAAGALPWWVYLLTVLALLAVGGVLYLRGI
jgi:hypothetical protein